MASYSGNRPPRRTRTPGSHDRARDDRAVTVRAGSPPSERAHESPPARSTSGRDHRGGHRPSAAGRTPRRSTAMTAAVLGAVLVLVAVIVILVVSTTGNRAPTGSDGEGPLGMQAAPPGVVSALTHLEATSFAQAGTTITSSGPFTGSLTVLKGQPLALEDGRPLVVYVGANWCPYCAATRWPLATALSRFGTFTRLRITSSGKGPGEPDPGTNTLSFYHSSYSSRYLAFSPTEECTSVQSSSNSQAVRECNGYEPLQTLSGRALEIFDKYDFPPYVPASEQGSIPFVDFGNKLIGLGAFVDPSILQGLSHTEIARDIANTASPLSRTILSAANYYTAAICELTHDRPGSVCKMSAVRQAHSQLGL